MDKIWRSPDVKIRLIENKAIITDKGISLSNVDIGDEITQVEGIEVHKYAKTRKYLIETSTDHYGTYRLYASALLKGEIGSKVNLTLKNKEGETYKTSLKRINKKNKLQKNFTHRWIGRIAYLKVDAMWDDVDKEVEKQIGK